MKDLERDLGLPSVLAISIGAMVGSGIFILPGLALKMAGPAVIIAYLLAALLVLPAALSKSEMATAMPEAGGTYLYIERGMGPLLGTIAGVGTWFSLTFKGALALIGGAPYLVLLFDLPVKPIAIGIGVILILINLIGVKQTGRLQVIIVVVMLAALTWFVAGSAPAVDPARYDQFFSGGITGLLAATGFVFVSYAGVTKIASVAEEIENPDRNIPIGMLGSLAFTTLLYIALVVVMIGVVSADALSGSNIPMALAADATLASVGVIAVVIAALIALVSTANAGILSSSRYPLAMSRDALAPITLSEVSDRFGTPVPAITLTGVVLLLMVAFVPILEIAKLASAFKILVFVLVNIALIAFREADLAHYEPSFTSPFYPVPQLVGIIGGLVLIPLMGPVALIGSLVIVGGSIAWYFGYVRPKGTVQREGAATDAIRQKLSEFVMAKTEHAIETSSSYDIMVGLTERTQPEREPPLLEIARAITRVNNGTVHITRFDEVPDQTPLDTASGTQTPGDLSFEERMEAYQEETGTEFEFEEVVSHDTKHAIVNHADRVGAEAILIERRGELIHTRLFGSDVDWVKRHSDGDMIEIEDRGFEDIDHITVISDRGPYDAEKVLIANALAMHFEATVELLFAVGPDAPAQQRETIQEYMGELASQFGVETATRIIEASDQTGGLIDASLGSDLVVISGGKGGIYGAVFGRPSDRVVEAVDCSAVVVTANAVRQGRFRRFLENRVF